MNFDTSFVARVIKPMLPVILNELFWALGITTYNAIYGRVGTESFAAMSEEAAKWILGIRRYFSRKWIHNLTVQ